MQEVKRPADLIMDIEDIRLNLERLSPLYSSSSDPDGAAGDNTHQIEINIENFVATFKKTCPDWEAHITRLSSSYSIASQANNQPSDDPERSSDSMVTSTDSLGVSSASSERSGGTYSSEVPSLTTSHQNLLMICGPEFLVTPTSNADYYLLNPDYVMGESSCMLTVLDVADMLQAKYAFISGGKTRKGCPIITFPDNPSLPEITDDQYKAVVNYLSSIPTLQEVDMGFALIVDRRQCGWGAVKTMLLRISGAFPGLVQEVLILRPSGFLQRTFTDMGFKFVKDDFKFKVLMCSSLEELYQYVSPDQLTDDLGGTISFNNHEWIQHRAAIEKFSANTSHIGQTLRGLCQRLAEVEFPNDVPSTEALVEEHEQEWKEVKEDLTSTIKHGDVLLSCFKSVRNESGEEEIIPSTLLPPSKLAHVTAVERLLVQLEETERNFDDFWTQHEDRLQQCLQLRKFEEDFKQTQYIVDRQLRMLETMTEAGDSISRVENLLQELANFEEESKDDISRADHLEAAGQQLMDDDHYAVDCIRPKCIELQRMCEQYKEMIRARYDVLNRSRDLHDRLDKANKWCTRGVDILANQPIDKCNTPGGAEEALAELEDFLHTAEQLKLNNPKEFRAAFDAMITPETKNNVQTVLKRIDDVQSMCDKRREMLRKQVAKNNRPVQPVVPEPATPIHKVPSSPSIDFEKKRKKAHSAANGMRRGSSSNKISTRIEVVRDGNLSDSSGSLDTDSGEGLAVKKPDPSAIREVDTLHAKRGQSTLKKIRAKLSSIRESVSSETKRGHVMRELIDTERAYVTELQSILEGYSDQLNREEMQDIIPQELVGKQHILFGNMDEIYDFHSKVFLMDLENCRNTPAMVGRCFVTRKEQFQMYSTYCQNKQSSEALRRQVGDNNPFFKDCQKRLNHRLPLGAYLLKPVQRITKYQLLLKEMLRYTQDEAGSEDLQEALDSMLSVLKYVNDIMHQVGITGYNGNLSECGRLLMQGSFNVWTAHKKDKIRDIRFKPMQRHIFLYEKKILFCKKKDDPQHVEKAAYIFKNQLDTASIGLTENVKGDKKKLELWLRGRAEVYICQAGTEQAKNHWVVEIKKVLFGQFDQLKGKHKKEIPTIPVSTSAEPLAYGATSTDQSSAAIDNSANNNPTVPVHLARNDSLPESRTTDEYSDDAGWSSDEFEEHNLGSDTLSFLSHDQVLALQAEYVALADYNKVDAGEISMREGDLLEVLKVGNEGWWYVRLVGSGEEGWAPASYLDSAKRRSSHSTFSMSSSESGGGIGVRNNTSRSSFNSNMSNSDAHGEETLV